MSASGLKIKAFLSYASDDRQLAERVARDLTAGGIETFYADWEIRPGDSIRAKVDHGLAGCTHFIVLLSPRSVAKPWVASEIDAAFMRKMEEGCTLIPLRLGLSPQELPPLLRGLHSPALDDYETDFRTLLGHLHGLERKPRLGRPPDFATSRLPRHLPVSLAASRIIEIMVKESEHGRWNDPKLSLEDLERRSGLTADELAVALDELNERGLVEAAPGIGVRPKARLFAQYDGFFLASSPSDDARVVVASLANEGKKRSRLDTIGGRLGWSPRRLNPAVTYLLENGLAHANAEITFPLVAVEIQLEPRAFLWLREP